MAQIANPFVLVPELCAALGIDSSSVQRVSIHVSAGEIPIATIETVVVEGSELAEVLREYELCPKGTMARLDQYELRKE